MDVKNKVELKVKSESYECCFICSNDTPLGFLFDALCEMRGFVKKQMDEEMNREKECQKPECCENQESCG